MQNHQAQNAGSGHLLRALVMHIPAGARDPYYYDQIGNVSTSRFQQAPRSSKRGSVDRWSALELKPRYPILGGWNYTFTVGYDLPLEDWASYDASRGRYIAAVPFFTAIPGAAVDQAEVKIILPEGAT
jgi:oligosaccharyltransferase complex subunit alpha (ribophorin I)